MSCFIGSTIVQFTYCVNPRNRTVYLDHQMTANSKLLWMKMQVIQWSMVGWADPETGQVIITMCVCFFFFFGHTAPISDASE